MLAGSRSLVFSELLRTRFDGDFAEIVDAHVVPKMSVLGGSRTDLEQVLNCSTARSC